MIDKITTCSKRPLAIDLFEQSIEIHPGKPALISDKETLTFLEVNTRANQLAAFMAEKGVVKSEPILFCFERGANAIISLLALLKLGTPYVPVGPDFPIDRIEMIAQDTKARFAVTDTKGLNAVESLNIDIINTDRLTCLNNLSAENPDTVLSANDTAWILYTSGSTGRPKGVMGTHLGLINRLEWMWKAQPFLPEEVCFQNTAFTTVDSFWEIMGPLCQGVPLQLLPDEVVKDANLLVQALSRYSIRRICLVPSYLSTILKIFPDLGERTPTTDLWVVSGEPLTLDICKRFYESKPDGWLSNQYGLTESCSDVTHFDTRLLSMTKSEELGEFNVPIGQPIDNIRLFVLDEDMMEMPIGIEGEIYLGGDCVSTGYLGLDVLTRERYIQVDSESELAKQLNFSGTLLRTGDRAVWRQYGELEYLGRGDDQVKMNGYRIELGEIESVIQRHPDIQDSAALVSVKKDLHRLVAFVTIKPEASERSQVVLEELRQLTVARLPAYMVPSLILQSDVIPRTSTGKIDRKDLEHYSIDANVLLTNKYVAPSSDTERWLNQQWSALLDIPVISTDVNFFTLGGHSLLATQLLSAINKYFGIGLSLRSFFQAPTIRALATQIEGAPKISTCSKVIIPQQAVSENYPLSLPQQRLWFISQLNPDSPVYHIPIAFELIGDLDINKLQQAFLHVVQDHPLLRARFIQENDQVKQVLAVTTPELEVCDSRWIANNDCSEQPVKLAQLLNTEAMQPMDLANEGAFRATLHCIAEKRHYLALTFHHLIADGSSLNLFLRQLSDAYNMLSEDDKPLQTEQNISYFDFAAWQKLQGISPEHGKQIEYWKEQLKNSDTLLPFPTDLPRPKNGSYRGALHEERIGKETLRLIKQLGLKHGASPFMSLLSVFSTILARYTGRDDIIVGTPASNRHYPDVDSIFGLFVNTVAIRSSCNDELSFAKLLEQVRDTTLAAFENQDVSFDKVVEALQQERNLSFNPIFQVMFDYQHRDELTLSMKGIQSEAHLVDPKSSRFDLSMTVLEDGDGALIKLEYSTDLFLPTTIERFCANFKTLLEAIVEQPDAPLYSYDLISAKENETLSKWNNTASDFPLSQNISQMFSQQAAIHSDAIAVVCKNKQLSYKELDKRSNQLAHYLQDHHNVRANQLVAVSLERSTEMVVALMAVMKSGAAYVPIDPSYPADRIEYMLTQSDARVLITSDSIQEQHDWPLNKTIQIDTEWDQISKASEAALSVISGPDDLVYVIFTSGSTGSPKGVQVVHRGLSNLILDMQQRLRSTENDSLLSVTTISFDIAGLELYLPLSIGAKLILADEEEVTNGERLAELINENQCSIMQATPVTWRSFTGG
ncbi:AMP-binding protein [Photobacterium leiognathi]|uniref:AMP-binding protein n=1 Tax=Photobacterium leiognathi TaxID=553611 RepID=UPI00273970D0|nr:AMP-binding protein [Photobacterium leiognathi]